MCCHASYIVCTHPVQHIQRIDYALYLIIYRDIGTSKHMFFAEVASNFIHRSKAFKFESVHACNGVTNSQFTVRSQSDQTAVVSLQTGLTVFYTLLINGRILYIDGTCIDVLKTLVLTKLDLALRIVVFARALARSKLIRARLSLFIYTVYTLASTRQISC